MAVIETAERLLPAGLRPAGSRLLRVLAAIVTGHGDKATAQRMALTAFSIRIVSAALAFISQIILARLMGEYEYGIFVFVWVLIVLFGDLSCLGFHTAIVRFLPQYKAAGAFEEIRGLTGTARTFAMLSGTLVMASGMAGLPFLSGRVGAYFLISLFLCPLPLPLVAPWGSFGVTSRAHPSPRRGPGPASTAPGLPRALLP
ncbi:oligosaccharide flippase family protein, partial [Rhizobium sp. SEMIA 4085]|uniref:lipopolysaccharide biosynthesis protein n=1 Tax=Rhizobium sp. SEMIA 4085 TaxID=2137761 RepID=UPI00147833DD